MTVERGKYSVAAAARLTGLTPDTLRAWERRHAAVTPLRTGSGRRMYREADVRRLVLLADAVRKGHAIGAVATLEDEVLVELLHRSARSAGEAASAPRRLGDLVDVLLEAVERYDPYACEHTTALALASMPIATVVDELVFPALVEVGTRWERGEMSIAQERLLSSVVRRLATNALSTLGGRGGTRRMLFGSLSGEAHELGALLAAVDAASRGVACAYVGADLPGREFARIADRLGVDCIVIGVVQDPPAMTTQTELRDLRAHLSRPAEIWLGGRGARHLDASPLDLDVVHVDTFADFRRRLR